MDVSRREATVVIAGRSGSGKSSLLNRLHGGELKREFTSISIAKDIDVKSTSRNGMTINMIDAPGLKELVGSTSQLLRKGFDVLVYCMPVSPGCKFHDGNPELMKSLQNIYGKEIWEHCVVVFTFSNLAWDRINSRNSDPESTSAMYKDYIEKYLDLFRKELQINLGVSIDTATVFHSMMGQHTIPAIPAGDTPQDPVLPGITSNGEGWRDKILQVIHSRSISNDMKITPKEQHNKAKFCDTTTACVVSIAAGALLVGGVGAVVGGAPGIVVGALIGAAAGKIINKTLSSY